MYLFIVVPWGSPEGPDLCSSYVFVFVKQNSGFIFIFFPLSNDAGNKTGLGSVWSRWRPAVRANHCPLDLSQLQIYFRPVWTYNHKRQVQSINGFVSNLDYIIWSKGSSYLDISSWFKTYSLVLFFVFLFYTTALYRFGLVKICCLTLSWVFFRSKSCPRGHTWCILISAWECSCCCWPSLSLIKSARNRAFLWEYIRWLWVTQSAWIDCSLSSGEAFRMSAQCGSDFHQCLRKVSWRFPLKHPDVHCVWSFWGQWMQHGSDSWD